MPYYETDMPTLVSNGNGNNNDGMFSGGWGGLIGLIAVAALFGWGGGGFGFGGGNNGALTRADLCEEMGFNGLENSVRAVQTGLSDGFYAMNTGMLNGFGQVQQTLCAGFNGVTGAITTSGYETRNAINGVSAQLASCCCELSRGQERLACDIERSTNAVVQAGNANTQRILDFLCNEKISALQNENTLLTAQLSQNSQTNQIINALRPTPVAAYQVPNPYTGAYGYGNNGCGCGCGCN